MIKIIKKMAFEPLFHFLIIGSLFYLYYNTVTTEQVKSALVIEISPLEIEELKSRYKQAFSKEISKDELKTLEQKIYYEKMLLNEAYSLGLDREDKEIQKRLLKQMQQIMRKSATQTEPTEEELYAYYMKRIEDYSEINTLSFTHIYFVNSNDEKTQAILQALQVTDVNVSDAAAFGDKFIEPNQMNAVSVEQIQVLFGKYFASKLFLLNKGMWHKPLHSKYGSHLVYITDKNVSNAYGFDEVQDRVYMDYMAEVLQKKEKESYEKISSQYKLQVN
jgi:hypothetical protein